MDRRCGDECGACNQPDSGNHSDEMAGGGRAVSAAAVQRPGQAHDVLRLRRGLGGRGLPANGFRPLGMPVVKVGRMAKRGRCHDSPEITAALHAAATTPGPAPARPSAHALDPEPSPSPHPSEHRCISLLIGGLRCVTATSSPLAVQAPVSAAAKQGTNKPCSHVHSCLLSACRTPYLFCARGTRFISIHINPQQLTTAHHTVYRTTTSNQFFLSCSSSFPLHTHTAVWDRIDNPTRLTMSSTQKVRRFLLVCFRGRGRRRTQTHHYYHYHYHRKL